MGPICSQNEAEVLQLLQSLLAPAVLSQDPAAWAGPSVGAIRRLGSILSPLPVHIDREGPAVKFQHSLLQNSRWGEEQEGPDGGVSPLLEGPGARTRQTMAALFLPQPQFLQSTCYRGDWMFRAKYGQIWIKFRKSGFLDKE